MKTKTRCSSIFCIILLLLLGNFTQGISQNRLSVAQEKVLSKSYLTKAEVFLKLPLFNIDSCEIYFNKAINVLKPNEAAHYQELSEINITVHLSLTRIKKSTKIDTCLKIARYYFDKIPKKSEQTKLLDYKILIREADERLNSGKQTEANKLMVKAFALLQENKSPEMQGLYLFDKAYLYQKIKTENEGNYGVEMSYRLAAQSSKRYEASKAKNKNEMLFKVYSLLTWYYNIKVKPDSADYYFDKQKALLPLINSPFVSAFYCSLRANSYMRRGQKEKALPLLNECKFLLEKYNLTQNQIYVFNTYVLGVRELELKKYDSAISLFQKGLDEAIKQKKISFISNGYQHLSNAYIEKGDFKTALKYYTQLYNTDIDEVDKQLNQSLQENELKLEIALKENEIAQKAKERNWYIAALFAGLFLLGLVYRNFRLKQKSNQQLEILNGDLANKNNLLDKRNAENELLLKEIHHRVKNNLEIVSSLLELQSSQIDDPSVQSAMLSSQNRVHSMGIIHQKLYQGEHLASIEMRDYFINLGENILDSYNADGRIKIECNMPELVLDVDTAISIGLIVNELLTNSLKYAFEGKDSGTIKISLENKDSDENLLLKIADDGIGKIPNKPSKGTGFGTQLINLLTKQLDGKLNYENNNGTIVSLIFKKTQMAS